MALQINISAEQSRSGIALQGYLRVMSVAFTREPMLRVMAKVWKDADARVRDSGKEPVAILHYALLPPADGNYSQAAIYAYLKTLPEFANAVDA